MTTRRHPVRALLSVMAIVVVVLAGLPSAATAAPAASVATGALAADDEPPPDSDGDGVIDDVDQCPTDQGLPEYNGCPAPSDRDGDGFADDVDQCPDTPGSATYSGCPTPDTDNDGVYDDVDQCLYDSGPASYNGCPVPDSDGDGLSDLDDACPNLPGPYDGCPLVDFDGDGVTDDIDQCPNVYGLGFDGCPIPEPDSDGDGVYDANDLCPNEFGSGTDGCPIPDPEPVTVVPAKVTFDDRCGHGHDTFTVPATTGVIYRRGDTVLAPATYQGRRTVKIVATAADGYVLSGKRAWTKTFADKRCRPGGISVTSPRRNAVRVVNHEGQPLTFVIKGRSWQVEPGETLVFSTRRDSVRWRARWDDFYAKRTSVVAVR